MGQNFGQEQCRTGVKTSNDFETDLLNIFFFHIFSVMTWNFLFQLNYTGMKNQIIR